MGFAFPFASVLAVRRRREEAEERSLAQLSSELEATRQALHRVDIELRRLADERIAEPPRSMRATDLHESYARLSVFAQGRSEMLTRITDLSARLQAQQQIYLLARRGRELLENLETAQRSIYLAGLTRQETKRNEDAFLSRYLRD